MPSSDLFVGRERELATLAARLSAASQGEAGIVLICGEPGIGKTRLLLEAAAHAEKQGWRSLLGHAYDSEGMPAYLPFIEALQDYVRLCPLEQLQLQLGDGGAQVAAILPEVRRRLSGLPAGPQTDAESARYGLFESVSEFLKGIAGGSEAGLLLCLEDLQWADDSTLLLLEHLSRRLTGVPFLVLATYRNADLSVHSPLARTLEQLSRQRVSRRLEITRLSETDVGSMLAVYGHSEPPPSLVEAVYSETEGNPFFVREVFEYLSESERLFDADGAWRTDLRIGEVDVPQGVILVIGRRLERLSEACKRLLMVASVLGRTFDYELLRKLADLPDEALLEALEQAEAAHLLASDDNATLTFAHELIRQTLLVGLTALRRQNLHLHAAEAMEVVYGNDLESHVAELARHYRLAVAPDPEKAIEYSRRAAEASQAVFAWEDAAFHYQGALHALKVSGLHDDSRECDLLLGLGEVLLAAGELTRILDEIAPAALALAQALGDDTRAFTACRIALSTPVIPPFWLETAQGCVGDDPIARISLNQALSVRAFHDGRFNDHKAVLLEALALARQARRPDLIMASALGLIRSGDLPAQGERDLFDELIAQPREGINTQDLSDFLFDAVATYLQWGERSSAETEGRKLAELAVQTGHYRAVAGSKAADCLFNTLDGLTSEAIKYRPTRGTYPHAWRGRLAGWLGDAGVLDAELAWSEDLITRSALGSGFKAFFLAYLGRLDEAREVLAEILPGIESRPKAQITSYWLSTLLLEAAVVSGDEAAARLLLDLNSGDDRRLAKPLFVLVPRHLAGAAALLGNFEKAKAGYIEAIEFCERISYRPELALTRLDMAQLLLRHYPGERSAAFEHLDLAIAEFAAMSMQPSLNRALRLRGRRRPATQPQERAYPGRLSAREVEVLRLVAAGKSNQQIADELAISLNTVMRHVANILNKTGAANRTEASSYAHRKSLV